MTQKWEQYYVEIVQQLKERVEEIGNEGRLEHIQQLITLISDKDRMTKQLEISIGELEEDTNQNQNEDEELSTIKNELLGKIKLYRSMIYDKGVLFDELISMMKQLLHRNSLINQNEEQIMNLQHQIKIDKLEMEQKQELVKELEEELENRKHEYKELKLDIKKYEKNIDKLQLALK